MQIKTLFVIYLLLSSCALANKGFCLIDWRQGFDDFFNEYLRTNAKLPLNNKLKFILHDSLECKDE